MTASDPPFASTFRPAAIVRSPAAVTLVGGARVRERDLDACLGLAPRIVAADSGAGHVLASGRVPDAVIGDMDSLAPRDVRRLAPETLHRVAEQDSTDFEKCLTRIDAPIVFAVGFTGRRIDHTLAVFNTLTRHADRPCLVIAKHEVIALAPPRITLDMVAGTRVSLFPMTQVRGGSDGLRWPIDGLALSPGGTVGTSNRATGKVRLSVDAPGLLVLLPRREFAALAAALADAPHW